MDRRDLPGLVQRWQQELEGEGLDFLLNRGLTPEYIDKYYFGFVTEGYYAKAISIPILDGLGQLKTVRFRRLDGEGPKYDSPKGEKAHLFNISSVRHPVVHITEGEFDATIIEQVGRHAVGVPGINNFNPAWKWLFGGVDVRIVFDSDEPGSEAWTSTRRAVGSLKRQLDSVADTVQVLELPTGHDVSSFYVQDPEGFLEVLAQYDA